MSQENNLIIQAEFNPKIKRYILFYVAFFFVISVMGIPLLLFWFLGVGQTLSKRYYEHLECRLTEKHLEFRKGYLFKVEKTIPLENIQDLTFIENPLLKYFDLRILKIETAGQSNMKGSDMKLVGIIDAIKFKKQVLDQREKLTARSYTTTTENSSQQTNKLLEEIKDLLTDIRDRS